MRVQQPKGVPEVSSSTAAATPPATASPLDDERDLFGVRSVVGAIGVLLVLTLFGVGLQALADSVRGSSGFTVGEPTAVSDTVAFVPAPGWINDPDQSVPGAAVVAQKNGWEIKIAAGLTLQPGQSLEDFARIFYDIPPDEPGSQVSDLETFTTTSGLTGVTWTVHGSTTTTTTWQIANGDQVTQVLAIGPSATLDSVQADLDAMAGSVTMENAAEEGQ
jgi:hypothetical protein